MQIKAVTVLLAQPRAQTETASTYAGDVQVPQLGLLGSCIPHRGWGAILVPGT